MYELIKPSLLQRMFKSADYTFIDDSVYEKFSEQKKRRYEKVRDRFEGIEIKPGPSSSIAGSMYRSESERSYRRDEDYSPPIMPDFSSHDSGPSYHSDNSSSSSDSGSSFDFGGGDGGGGGASSDY